MPYYANAGEAFWNGANAGANMASKWVNAYDWGDKYRSNNAFKEGSAEAMSTYNKSIEDAKAIQDEGQRQKAIQDATELRNNTVRKLALALTLVDSSTITRTVRLEVVQELVVSLAGF